MKGTELSESALGLIGFGRIAQGVANVAKSLGMEIHTYDPYLSKSSKSARCIPTQESRFPVQNMYTYLYSLQSNEETHHLVNAKRSSMMPGKKSGINCGNHIVNCACGGIIERMLSLNALEDGTITSAALDVLK